jgi:hypothetical protein
MITDVTNFLINLVFNQHTMVSNVAQIVTIQHWDVDLVLVVTNGPLEAITGHVHGK